MDVFDGRVAVILNLAMGSVVALLSLAIGSMASAERTVDVQFENKTFHLSYNMSNGGSVESASAESNQPYGGALLMQITSPSKSFLEVAMPRELFDLVGFTDHFGDGFELTVFIDESSTPPIEITYLSCDKIIMRIPLETRSEQIDIVTTDMLQVHGHPYPPALHIIEKIEVDESEFNVHMWTDAIKCDVSFSKAEKKLHIDINGRNETSGGGFSIAIPPQLLGGNYTVLVDGKKVNFTEQSYIEYVGSSLDNFVLNKLGLQYPAGAKTIDVVGTSLLDPKSAFRAFSLFHTVHERTHIINAKAQAGIDILNSTILPNLGIYIDIETTSAGLMELTLDKSIIESVQLIEVNHSDIQESVSFDVIEENEVHTVIQFPVMDGAQQVAIKGAGGIVPEFGSFIAPFVMAVAIIGAIVATNWLRK